MTPTTSILTLFLTLSHGANAIITLKRMTLSAIVLTRNNQTTLDACLRSLSFADELIVVDDSSTDDTLKIAANHHAKIINHPLTDFGAQRNFALTHAIGRWILFVDSDEIVPQDLRREINQAIKQPGIAGFYLRRRDIFLGRLLKHGETSQVRLLRLAQKNAGTWVRPVHEYWQIVGATRTLSHPLIHHRRLTFTQFFARINRYTDLDVQALLEENKPFSYRDLFLKPVGKFIYNYFFLLGFLDAFPGFIMTLSMSLHSLIVRIKLYEHAT